MIEESLKHHGFSPELDDSSLVELSVGPNDKVEIEIPPSDKASYFIHTLGRISCDAVALLSIAEDLTVRVTVTHFDSLRMPRHLAQIRLASERHSERHRHSLFVTWLPTDILVHEMQSVLKKFNDGPGDTLDVSQLNISSVDELKRDHLMYQLCVMKGYHDDPNQIRIWVPGTTYDETVLVDSEPPPKKPNPIYYPHPDEM
jgi:hypothetical protein